LNLAVEHNLGDEELANTIIALTKSHGLEYEIHECLSKARKEDIPVEPRDPYIAELLAQFRQEYVKATEWVREFLDRFVAGETPPLLLMGKLAKARWLFKARPVTIDGPLTKQQVRYIQDLIRERFGYIARNLESDFQPDKKLLKKWQDMGIISPDVTIQDFVSANAASKLVRNAFVFGRLHHAIDQGGLTFDQILKMSLELPLTKPNQYAIEAAEREAAHYITKFGEDIAGEAGRLIDAKNRQIVHEMVANVHRQKLEAIKLREGAPDRIVTNWRQLSSEMYHTMQDKARDWDRIAYTELTNTNLEGRAAELLQKWGPDALVYKTPLPTACEQCKFLYLKDGIPRLFKLTTMIGYGSNVGRKPHPVKGGVVTGSARSDGAETLKPVVGVVHPWCQCRLFLATGYEHWYEQAEKPQ
jgi:hypothetical protein